jgi:hypothetical protein
LPASCLWTSLRESEGFNYDQALTELKTLYPADEPDGMDDDGETLNGTLPQSVRDMIDCKGAMEALGAMIWSVPVIVKMRTSLTPEQVSSSIEYRQGYSEHEEL